VISEADGDQHDQGAAEADEEMGSETRFAAADFTLEADESAEDAGQEESQHGVAGPAELDDPLVDDVIECVHGV
jgi:hypothetical protein